MWCVAEGLVPPPSVPEEDELPKRKKNKKTGYITIDSTAPVAPPPTLPSPATTVVTIVVCTLNAKRPLIIAPVMCSAFARSCKCGTCHTSKEKAVHSLTVAEVKEAVRRAAGIPDSFHSDFIHLIHKGQCLNKVEMLIEAIMG